MTDLPSRTPPQPATPQLPPVDPSVEAQEFSIKREELKARQAEAAAKLRLANAPWWMRADPLVLAVAAGVLTLAGNIGVAWYNGRETINQEQIKAKSALALEREKAKSSLITHAISTDNPAAAQRNILFFLDSGLLPDPGDTIRQAAAKYNPVLPGPAPAQQPIDRGLYQQPVLIVDPGMPTQVIRALSTDARGTLAVIGSEDKTLRIWSLSDGKLLQTIRVPAGPGNIGKLFAVAFDPAGRLIAAGGWSAGVSGKESIYLFGLGSSEMVARIDGLPNVTTKLLFSPDGRFLAAAFGDGSLRIYARDKQWAEVFRDTTHSDSIYGLSFAPDGRLAAVSYDGSARLYNADFKLAVSLKLSHGEPYQVAFSPNGNALAIGFADASTVELRDGHSLQSLSGPNVDGIAGTLPLVQWSKDGQTLFGGGGNFVVAWSEAGHGKRVVLEAGKDTTTGIETLPDGAILIATADPSLKCLNKDGSIRWSLQSPAAYLRKSSNLAVSTDGTKVDFGLLRFDVSALQLTNNPPRDHLTSPANVNGLPITNWKNGYSPVLAGNPIQLGKYEESRSLAVHPSGDSFVLGTTWNIRAFDKTGQLLWRSETDVVLTVNISGDGRLVIAACGDGTIRWYRMDDGRELLRLMVMADNMNWVAWTPEGFYGATLGARGVLQWYVNRGPNSAGVVLPLSDLPQFYRPEVLARNLKEQDITTRIRP
jgi:WD40 repeat protein